MERQEMNKEQSADDPSVGSDSCKEMTLVAPFL